MNPWLLLWILWPLSGLLGWAWTNYACGRMFPNTFKPHPEKWVVLVLCLFIGPLAFLAAAMAIGSVEPSRRYWGWGLRFW